MNLKFRVTVRVIFIWEIIMIIIAIIFFYLFNIPKIFGEPLQTYHTYICFIFILVLFLIIFPVIMTILGKYQE